MKRIVVCLLIALIFISCKKVPEYYVEIYTKDEKSINLLSDKKGHIYKGAGNTSSGVLYDNKGKVTEIRNLFNLKLFGDRLFFINNSLNEYYFMTNDTNTSCEVKFNTEGRIISFLGTPLVYEELGGNTIKDSFITNMYFANVIFKKLILKVSEDGKKYKELNLVSTNEPRFTNNKKCRYAIVLPPKKHPYINLYRLIECTTIYDEKKVFRDTLSVEIYDKYLKD